MKRNRWKVRLNKAGRGTVEMDGEPVRGVTYVLVEAGVNLFTKISLELIAEDVDVEVDEAVS